MEDGFDLFRRGQIRAAPTAGYGGSRDGILQRPFQALHWKGANSANLELSRRGKPCEERGMERITGAHRVYYVHFSSGQFNCAIFGKCHGAIVATGNDDKAGTIVEPQIRNARHGGCLTVNKVYILFACLDDRRIPEDRKSTRLNSSHS